MRVRHRGWGLVGQNTQERGGLVNIKPMICNHGDSIGGRVEWVVLHSFQI